LTRRWNYRDADATKITEETRELVMFLDASPAISIEKVEEAIEELKTLYEKHCGGECITKIASKENPVIELGG